MITLFLFALSVWVCSGFIAWLSFMFVFLSGPTNTFYWMDKTFTKSNFSQFPLFFSVPATTLISGIFGLIAAYTIICMMYHIKNKAGHHD